MAAILAISAAFFYGLGNVSARVGLRGPSTLLGAFISLLSTVGASLVASLFIVHPSQFISRAILFFVVAGILGPFIARFLLFTGINRVGASIATPLYQTRSLFSAIAAVTILGEGLTPSIGLGILLIIMGGAITSSEESGGQIERKWVKRDLVFPIMSGLFFGLAHVFRKMGLNVLPEPLIGVTVQNITSLAFISPFVLLRYNQWGVTTTRNWVFLILSGFCGFMGQLFFFYALAWGDVVIVAPLSSISSLFVILLVRVFLKRMERITLKIVLGSILIVAGTVAITLVS